MAVSHVALLSSGPTRLLSLFFSALATGACRPCPLSLPLSFVEASYGLVHSGPRRCVRRRRPLAFDAEHPSASCSCIPWYSRLSPTVVAVCDMRGIEVVLNSCSSTYMCLGVTSSTYPQQHQTLQQGRPRRPCDEEQGQQGRIGVRGAPVQQPRGDGEEGGQVAGQKEDHAVPQHREAGLVLWGRNDDE